MQTIAVWKFTKNTKILNLSSYIYFLNSIISESVHLISVKLSKYQQINLLVLHAKFHQDSLIVTHGCQGPDDENFSRVFLEKIKYGFAHFF